MRQITLEEKSPRILELEESLKQPIHDLLFDMYVLDSKSKKEIANELGVNRASVARWLDMCHIYHQRLEVE